MRMRVIAMLVLCVTAATAAAAQDWEPRRRHRDGLHLRVARDYHLPADQIATAPVIVVGGSATIDGRLEDDLVVVGGHVRVGPTAQIRGDIVALASSVDVSDSAEVSGEIQDVSIIFPELQLAFRDWLWGVNRGVWAMFALVATAVRFAFLLIACCFIALVAPQWVRRIEQRVVESSLPAALVGVAAELLFLPLLLALVSILVITVIGIPLLVFVPFAVLFFVIVWLAGFTSVAVHLGGALRRRFNMASDSPAIDAAWGVLAIFLITFLGNILAFTPGLLRPLSIGFGAIGFLVEYLAWTVGLGAALLAPIARRWGTTVPPPVPTTATASA